MKRLCLSLFVVCFSLAVASAEELRVVGTTAMVADLVRQVGGDKVKVDSLMGPGVDPHLYKATHGDLKKLGGADLIVYSGLHLEGKMGEILESLGESKPVIAVTSTLPQGALLAPPEYEGQYDPHVWFDVSLWKETVPVVRDALIKARPDHSAYFSARADQFRESLSDLHAWVTRELSQIPPEQRVLVTAHDAFGYFGRAYKVDVIGLQGISTATEYGLADVRRVVGVVVDRNVKAIFVESSVPRQFVDAIVDGAKKRGHIVVVGGELFSDSMGEAGTKEATYIGMVEHNVRTIVGALK